MSAYTPSAATRAEIDALSGATIIEFGTNWCGFCRAAQPHIAEGLRDVKARHADLRHLKIEDGRGRALGRSFEVKLWPTLIFMKDGTEVARVVRPESAQAVGDAARQIAP